MDSEDRFNTLGEEERKAVRSLLEKYKGHLSITQIAEGIRVTLENARCLFDDASALAQSGRLARSMALLVATMEEVGKISVLASMSRIPTDNRKLWSDAWESFRKHQHKSTWAFVHTYPDEARAFPELLVGASIQQFNLADVAERLRQYGLYVDFHAGEKRWISPQEVSAADVENWVKRAESALLRAEGIAALGLFSQRALEIQNQVYAEFGRTRPRRKDTRESDVERALDEGPRLARAYFRRLVEEGVLSADADLEILGVPLNGPE
jgi:AbiV family abortive infection protein